MTVPRDVRLTPEELALKLAFREAVTAAGGQVFVAGEVGRVQSRISEWCSPNTADFAPVDVVRKVEALAAGGTGHPHVTRALARAAGLAVRAAGAHGGAVLDHLGDWLAALARESADLTGALAEHDLAGDIDRLPPNARALIGTEARQLIDVLERLCRSLDGHAAGGGRTAEAADDPVVPIRRSDSS